MRTGENRTGGKIGEVSSRKNFLSEYVKTGFSELERAEKITKEILEYFGCDTDGGKHTHEQNDLCTWFLQACSFAADPDSACVVLRDLLEKEQSVQEVLCERVALERFFTLIGASDAFGDFFLRHPECVREVFHSSPLVIPSREEIRAALCDAVTEGRYTGWITAKEKNPGEEIDANSAVQLDALTGFPAWNRLRVRYRTLLAQLMLYDLINTRGAFAEEKEHGFESSQIATDTTTITLPVVDALSGDVRARLQYPRVEEVFRDVSRALADLAQGALEAALLTARASLVNDGGNGLPVPRWMVEQTKLAIIAMGKCGAEELNVVSDVDVLFIAVDLDDEPVAPHAETATQTVFEEGQQSASSEAHEPLRQRINREQLIRTATRIANEAMRAIQDAAEEPPLWQVDPNLRPEGRNGPLVRTLRSYLTYYDKWAETWEFQALLKARAIAGDLSVGEEFVRTVSEKVWQSRYREDFVPSVRRMRERVTEHLSPAEADVHLKLGTGGLRDVEFSVQLLQLVHGSCDTSLRTAGTIAALTALVNAGYVARSDGKALARAYIETRILEHRLQLHNLRRTELFPQDAAAQRRLARASSLAATAEQLKERWSKNKQLISSLHHKIFYAPMLNTISQLESSEISLSEEAVADRLASIGFVDTAGAVRHIRALTSGTSRHATILKNLFPVLLRWFAAGTNPDQGLLAFRRLNEAASNIPWFLRVLRDGFEAAERLTRVLSTSQFTSDLLVSLPEAVAWLEGNEKLQAPKATVIEGEMRAVAKRRDNLEEASEAVRAVHRREILRIALARVVNVFDDDEVAEALDNVHTALLRVLLEQIERLGVPAENPPSLALIAMGRYGGRELGFSSDLDIIAVYDGHGETNGLETAQQRIAQLRNLVSDPRFTVDLDFGLRPEGKNGAFVRTLEGYRSYYEKWSLTWEAQALLRARFVAGDEQLGRAFEQLIAPIRYPEKLGNEQVREIRRLKARMESERLPAGISPKRHVKLGPGGMSDTEWLVQLIQLQHAHSVPELQTVSTIDSIRVAVEQGLLGAKDADALIQAWRFATSLRSAEKLFSGRSSDVLSDKREELAGIADMLGMNAEATGEIEERWFRFARLARQVFEREFYGETVTPIV